MTLIPQWKRTLARAWSVWAMIAALVLQIGPDVLSGIFSIWSPGPVAQLWLNGLTLLATLTAIGARIIKQKDLTDEQAD